MAAAGRDFVGVEFTARERGKGDASISEQVEVFVDNMTDDGEVRPEYEETTNWEKLEETHGEQADELLRS